MSITTTTTKPAQTRLNLDSNESSIFKNIISSSRGSRINVDSIQSLRISRDELIELETATSERLISQALAEKVLSVDSESCEPGAENSFFVCDLGKVERLVKLWKRNLPRVHPFYAVKCNPNVEVLKVLAALGCNFDCASKGEIDMVLSLGVDPSRIVYANPCKVGSFLRFAEKNDINLTTFDNTDELYKIAKFHPGCKLLLRIITDDENAQCRLSTKFGAPLSNVNNLLSLAQELGLSVVGVSFHVGSGANDDDSLIKAVRDARDVFQSAKNYGFEMNLLDVGGGFSYESFESSSQALNWALDEYFPVESSSNINIIAEPGRYFVANAFTLAAHIIAKRGGVLDQANGSSSSPNMIYINDGVYGNMNCILFDHQTPTAHVLTHRGEFVYDDKEENNKHNVSIWGPTCDGLDCIAADTHLSHNVAVGDWLYFPNLGAYTSAAASPFNGFEAEASTIYINSERE